MDFFETAGETIFSFQIPENERTDKQKELIECRNTFLKSWLELMNEYGIYIPEFLEKGDKAKNSENPFSYHGDSDRFVKSYTASHNQIVAYGMSDTEFRNKSRLLITKFKSRAKKILSSNPQDKPNLPDNARSRLESLFTMLRTKK